MKRYLNPVNLFNSYYSDLFQFGRNLQILLFAAFLNSMGTGFILPFVAIYFNNVIGIKYSLIGLALGLRGGVGLIFKLVGGQASDRIGRKWTIATAGTFFIFAYIAYLMTSSYLGLIVAVVVHGIGIGLFWPSTMSMISDLLPGELKEKGFALSRAARMGGLAAGVALGGIISTFTYRGLFYLDILLTFGFLVIFVLKVPETMPKTDGEDNKGHLRKALADPKLMGFAVINVVFAILAAQLFNILPPYFKDFLNVRNFLIGNMFLVNAGLIALFQLKVTDRIEGFDSIRTFKLGFVLWLAAVALIYLASPGLSALVLATLALVFLSLASMVYGPTAASFVSDIASKDNTGTYFSIYSVSFSIGFIAGPAIGGYFLDQPNPQNLWLLFIAMIIGALILLEVYKRKILG